MPRRREIAKRELLPDPLYQSQLVTKFINTVMYDGKKSTAESILYTSFDIIKDKTGDDPLKVFKKAIENAKPTLEVPPRRGRGLLIGCGLLVALLLVCAGTFLILDAYDQGSLLYCGPAQSLFETILGPLPVCP